MHEYVSTMVQRFNVVARLALVSAGAAIGLGALLRLASAELPFYFAPPGALTIFGLSFALYDQVLWRRGIGRRRFSAIPDLNGQWEGKIDIRGGRKGKGKVDYDCTIRIRQSWSRISIVFETSFTRSTSVMASLRPKEEPHGGLRYEYDVTPKPGEEPPAGEEVARHFGMARLQPVKNSWDDLTGEFYNDRSFQRWGVYKMKKVPPEDSP